MLNKLEVGSDWQIGELQYMVDSEDNKWARVRAFVGGHSFTLEIATVTDTPHSLSTHFPRIWTTFKNIFAFLLVYLKAHLW